MERDVEKLIENYMKSGAGLDRAPDRGQAILLLIAERDLDNVAKKIAKQAGATTMQGQSKVAPGQMQLLIAAYYGDDKEAQRVAKQFNINLRMKHRSVGACALFLAVERGHAQLVESLLGDTIGANFATSSHPT